MTGIPKSSPVLQIALVACLVFARATMADLVQFEIQGGGGRLITLDSVLKDKVSYVPLEGLVEQAGGSYNVLPTRLRVDLGGSTAWLRAGESRVHALSIFSLDRPIAEDDSGALIATDDVAGFFLKSFRVTLRPVGAQPAPTAVPPSTPLTSPPPPGASVTTPPRTPGEAPPLEQLGTPATTPGVVTSIIIDAGHGGYDAGLQSDNKHTEETIVLGIATRLKGLLQAAHGPVAVLTRSEDMDTPAAQRARLAETAPGSLFISIHTGSSLSPTAEGITVFYPTASPSGSAGQGISRADTLLSANSRRLAEIVAAAAVSSAGAPLRGIVQAPLKMLSELQTPAIEIEVGCLTSAADTQRLSSDEYLAQLAAGIFNGITAYLSGATLPASPSAAAATPGAN